MAKTEKIVIDDVEFEINENNSKYNKPEDEYDDPAIIYRYLERGWRTPQNDLEREVLEQMEEIKRKGGIVQHYDNFI
ncbi:MAG: hypothetical protein QM564_02960 [Bergeyella sp.]